MGTSAKIAFKWIVSIAGAVAIYHVFKKNDKKFVSARDKNGKIHKIPVCLSDSKEEVVRKVEEYMSKNT